MRRTGLIIQIRLKQLLNATTGATNIPNIPSDRPKEYATVVTALKSILGSNYLQQVKMNEQKFNNNRKFYKSMTLTLEHLPTSMLQNNRILNGSE